MSLNPNTINQSSLISQKNKKKKEQQHLFVIFYFSPIKISVKDFSGSNASRILKFGINNGYESLCCGKANWYAPAYSSFFLFVHFSFSPKFYISSSKFLSPRF